MPKNLNQATLKPHSIEAEQSVLGGLMLDQNAWDKIVDRLSEKDFYRRDHQLIFNAISDLIRHQKPLDVLTVSETLKHNGLLDEAGGEVYLFELAKNTPSAANVVAYADIVRERAILRRLIETSQDIAHSAFNPEGRESAEILDDAERRIFEIAEQKSRSKDVKKVSSLLGGVVDRIDFLYKSSGNVTGLETGYHGFDEMTSGLQVSDLVIVAGRPSMGKTSFAMNIAERAAVNKKNPVPVLIFSMEMSAESLTMRMLASLGRINQHKIRTGQLDDEDWPKITSAVSLLSEAPMLIDDTPALSPSELRARARRIHREYKNLGLIVIDYIQLMQVHGTRENRTTEVSEISRNLKALAKELNVPVLALSQLNRSLEQRADKRPVMSDLRESGSLEQDADLIAFIYRDEVYNENSNAKGQAEVIISKQRNGPIGKVRLAFLGKYTRFENLAPESY